MAIHKHVHADGAEAAGACCRHVTARLEEALSGQAFATLAISGGASPRLLFGLLATSNVDWSRVHLFWVDERMVPPGDPDSNYGLAEEILIKPARIPHRNVHRVRVELRPDEAAHAYSSEIASLFGLTIGALPHFDVMHLGMGADGHTASLFPGDPLIEDRERIAAAAYMETRAQWRVTLLPGVLLAARHTVLLVTGADKAESIRAVFEESYDPLRLPVQLVAHHGRSVTWFVDRAAGSAIHTADQG